MFIDLVGAATAHCQLSCRQLALVLKNRWLLYNKKCNQFIFSFVNASVVRGRRHKTSPYNWQLTGSLLLMNEVSTVIKHSENISTVFQSQTPLLNRLRHYFHSSWKLNKNSMSWCSKRASMFIDLAEPPLRGTNWVATSSFLCRKDRWHLYDKGCNLCSSPFCQHRCSGETRAQKSNAAWLVVNWLYFLLMELAQLLSKVSLQYSQSLTSLLDQYNNLF